jgi:hypothetical protein
MKYFVLVSFLIFLIGGTAHAGTKSKKHGHDGILKPFSGKHIGYKISLEDAKKLDKGNPVSISKPPTMEGLH